MPSIQVRGAKIEYRTTSLTKALLNQFRRLDRFPEGFLNADSLPAKPECVLGWVHGSTVANKGTDFERYLVFQWNGDWFVFGCWRNSFGKAFFKDIKQLYM